MLRPAAAKLVGRWRSGAPLTLAPEQDEPELGADPSRNNAFTYAGDPRGHQLPLGSHMRRMNPARLRDGAAHRRQDPPHRPAQHDLREALRPGRTHRRGRRRTRGLCFIFLCAKAIDTLEFLQREWINNGNFMSLGSERNPNVGLQEAGATFTIPQAPVRRRIHGIETFNALRGGKYFFVPLLTAMRWIANLP